MWQVVQRILIGRFQLEDNTISPDFAASYHGRVEKLKAGQALQKKVAADAAQPGTNTGAALTTDVTDLGKDAVASADPRLKEASELIKKGDKASLNKAAELVTSLADEHVKRLQNSVHELNRDAYTAADMPGANKDLLSDLANDPDLHVRLRLAGNRSAPPDALRQLARDSDPYVQNEVAKNSSLPPDAFKDLAGSPDENLREQLAGDEKTPPEALVILAQDKNWKIASMALQNKSTPDADRLAITKKLPTDYRANLAGDPKTPPVLLTALAADKEHKVRAGVARNEKAPLETLRSLQNDRWHEVLMALAGNKATPPDVLKHVAHDQQKLQSEDQGKPYGKPYNLHMFEREAVAGNKNAPPEVLEELGGDVNPNARGNVANNPTATPKALRNVHDRSNPAIKDRHSYYIPEVVASMKDQARLDMVNHQNLPPDLVIKLSKDANPAVRAAIAGDKRIQPAELRALANDPDYRVRAAVARNENTPLDVLKQLQAAKYPDTSTKSAICNGLAENPKAPPDMLAALAADPDARAELTVAKHRDTPEATLVQLAGNNNADIAGAVAKRATITPAIANALAANGSWSVRAALAAPQDVPDNLLMKLAKDPDIEVRKAVATNQKSPPEALVQVAKGDPKQMIGEEIKMLDNPRLVASPVHRQQAMLAMIRSDNQDLKMRLISMQNADPYIISVLAGDKDPEVASTARRYMPAPRP